MHISAEEREKQTTIHLSKAEIQTLIDRNIDNKSMEEACKSMAVSKTVYAGICASAREKVTRSIVE